LAKINNIILFPHSNMAHDTRRPLDDDGLLIIEDGQPKQDQRLWSNQTGSLAAVSP